MKNVAHFINDLMLIEIVHKGKTHFCVLDIDDADRAYEYTWHLIDGYASSSVDAHKVNRYTVQLHKLINKSNLVDHKNTIKLDNRKSNLRATTREINALNTSKLTGVSFDKKKRKENGMPTLKFNKRESI